MRRIVELLLICILVARPAWADEPAGDLTQEEREAGWIELFDGRTLDGWQAGSKADWTVVDGAIKATSGEPGLLCTERQFRNFELRLEFRAPDTTNSGVFLRTPLVPTDPTVDCYELNIAPPPFPTGSFVKRKRCIAHLAKEGWQRFDILAKDEHFEVDLNGERVLEHVDPMPLPAGLIGLQFREGPIEFRRIRIRSHREEFLPQLRPSDWGPPRAPPPVVRSTQLRPSALHRDPESGYWAPALLAGGCSRRNWNRDKRRAAQAGSRREQCRMARLSMNEMTTYRWSFEEDVAQFAAAGFDAIGVWRQKLSDFGEEKGIELLAESGLKVSNLLWAGGFTGSDGRTLRESIDDALDAIRLAAEMRADCLVVYTGARAGHTHSHVRRLLREALTKIVPAAEEHGVTLALEPMHPDCAAGFTFLTCPAETLELIASLDSPALKLAFDTYHLGFNRAALDRIADMASQIAVVHLGDGRAPRDREQNRSLLGQGEIPLAEIITKLEASGYRGYYDIELLGEEIEVANYHDVLVQSKLSFGKLLVA